MIREKNRIRKFRRLVWDYYRAHGRDLEWRRTQDPYAIVVSEIMLQQTQVGRVRGKYSEFLKEFPDFPSLARATPKAVLRAWQGLGYNRRALSLWKLAQAVKKKHEGKLPRVPEELNALPGIGRATAGSVAAFAWNLPTVFVETNVRRALIHHFFPRTKEVPEKEVEELAAAVLDRKRPREWYWALMDYGSMLGRTIANPNRRSRKYRKQAAFRGSDRELRGRILRMLLQKPRLAVSVLGAFATDSGERLEKVLQALEKEGFLRRKGGTITITE